MTIKQYGFNVSGDYSALINDQDTLITAVETTISDAETANAVAGSNADVTTELAAITAALADLEANIATGAVVVSVDFSLVTTKNQLRTILDKAYRQIADAAGDLS